MITRHTPLARSTKPIARTPLKRSLKPIAKVGKVGKRKQLARDLARVFYFLNHGTFRAGDKTRTANCQLCGKPMKTRACHIHHKKPRGEGGSDALENMVALHGKCHIDLIHDRQMGRPFRPLARARFEHIEKHPANILNGWLAGIPGEVLQ